MQVEKRRFRNCLPLASIRLIAKRTTLKALLTKKTLTKKLLTAAGVSA